MNLVDAMYEYLKKEIIPLVSGDSEFTGALLNGALRTGRKKLAGKLGTPAILQSLGLVAEDGGVDAETFGEFADGFFEDRDVVALPVSDIIGTLTGVDTESPLLGEMLKLLPGVDPGVLDDKLKFTRADADKFLELLRR